MFVFTRLQETPPSVVFVFIMAFFFAAYIQSLVVSSINAVFNYTALHTLCLKVVNIAFIVSRNQINQIFRFISYSNDSV